MELLLLIAHHTSSEHQVQFLVQHELGAIKQKKPQQLAILVPRKKKSIWQFVCLIIFLLVRNCLYKQNAINCFSNFILFNFYDCLKQPNLAPGRNILFLTTLSIIHDLLPFYPSDSDTIWCSPYIHQSAWIFSVVFSTFYKILLSRNLRLSQLLNQLGTIYRVFRHTFLRLIYLLNSIHLWKFISDIS